MARHNVHVNLPWREIGKSDVEFEIYKDEEVLGKMKISKGNLEWYPKNAKKPYSIGWSHFDKMIREYFEEE